MNAHVITDILEGEVEPVTVAFDSAELAERGMFVASEAESVLVGVHHPLLVTSADDFGAVAAELFGDDGLSCHDFGPEPERKEGTK